VIINLKKVILDIYNRLEDNIVSAERQIKTFGILMAINFPLYLIIWYYETPGSYQNPLLRVVATLLCIGLILRNYWPENIKFLFSSYWYFTIIFTLPFFFAYMTLKNGASTLWLMNLMSVLFFVFLLLDIVSALTVLFIGSLVALITFKFTSIGFFINHSPVTLTEVFVTFVAAIIIGGFFTRNREAIEGEKLLSMKALSMTIAHELRTPLCGIDMQVSGIKRVLPYLVDAYELAKRNGVEVKLIKKSTLDTLNNSADIIKREVRTSNNFIDLMLTNLKRNIKDVKLQECRVKDIILNSVDRYPLHKVEKERIEIGIINDFKLLGNETLLMHVMFNLLKNGLYYIHSKKGAKIYIHTERGDKYNIIVFRDTGEGIDKSILPNIFKEFYSKTYHGTGVGLAFCNKVLLHHNGKITCKSEKGAYTEFRLFFPKLGN